MHDRDILVPCDDSVVRVVDRCRTAHPSIPRLRPAAGRTARRRASDARRRRRSEEHAGRRRGQVRVAEPAHRRHGRPRHAVGLRRGAAAPARAHRRRAPKSWSPTPSRDTARRRGRAARRGTARPVRAASPRAHRGGDGRARTRRLPSRCSGFAFDGTGYGPDGAVWGGEVLLADYKGYRRLAQLEVRAAGRWRPQRVRPYRMALAHLWAAGLPWDADLAPVRACPRRRAPGAAPPTRDRTRHVRRPPAWAGCSMRWLRWPGVRQDGGVRGAGRDRTRRAEPRRTTTAARTVRLRRRHRVRGHGDRPRARAVSRGRPTSAPACAPA